MTKCDRCGQPRVLSEVDCPVCGRILSEAEGVGCEVHEGATAVACCSVCGKPMCGDCAVWTGSQFLCNVPAHKEVADDWQVIARCSSVFEADMIMTNLRQGEFKPMAFSPGEFTVSFWHSGLSTARVFVRKGESEGARRLLQALALP